MSQLVFDDDLSRRLESMYSKRDFQRRRRLVLDALSARPGDRVLDVGCGPGFYLAELLETVGPQGAAVGIDGSTEMLGLAEQRCEQYPNAVFHVADANSLPVDDASFDAALSVQVLEYVGDVDQALAEIHRALRPGGRVVVWDTDWSTVSWHSADAERMASVLKAWDAHLSHPSLPRTLARRLRSVGFDGVTAEAHAFATVEFSPESAAVSLMPAIEKYVAGREGMTEEEARSWAEEQRELGERGEFFSAAIQFCFTATRL